MPSFRSTFFGDSNALANAVARKWLEEIEAANRARKPHCVALSGGRISQKFYAAVVEILREVRRAGDPQFRDSNMPSLPNVHFFWADERCVPPDDPESNFCVARELLFTPLKIGEDKIHRVRGEELPDVAAEKATAEICRIVPRAADGQPVLDLIILGMGEDGHVASLFPGEPESAMTSTAVYRAVTNAPKPPPNRVTLGYATIAAAKQVWVLVSGPGKEAALSESLRGGKTPLAYVLALRRHTLIFSDISLK